MKKSLFPRLLAMLLTLSLLVPGLPPASAVQAEGDHMISVSLSSENLSGGKLPLTLDGGGQTLTASLQYYLEGQEAALPAGASVVWAWESDRPGIVTAAGYDETAVVTPVSVGADAAVRVTATVTLPGGVQLTDEASCDVTVSYAATTGITLNQSTAVLDPSDTLTLTATVQPPSADPTNLSWETTDPNVVSLSTDSGSTVLVKALAPGRATVTVKFGTLVAAACTVEVNGLVLDRTTLTIRSGKSEKLTATGYGRVSYADQWTSSNESVATVASDGTVTAKNAGEAIITATSGGDYPVPCKVTVEENTAGVIKESINAGQPLSLSDLAKEMDSQCRSVLGDSLSYVTGLSVSSTDQGILYYGYVSADDTGSGVSSQEKYYYSGSASAGRLNLSDITFVAKPDFKGTATISYTGYNSSNQFFSGTIRVDVEETEDVVYSTGVNTPLTFSAADFSAACRNQNGRDAKFVTFTLPSSRYGTLYYNYIGSGQLSSPVEEDAEYYTNNNPYLDKVTFVPEEDYSGTVRISYSGKDTAGYSFSGRVTIYVSGSSGGSGDINYSTRKGEEIAFKNSDFNSLCRDVTGHNMDYVRFTLPSSSQGTLYYDYTSSGNYDSKVTNSTRYYRSGKPYLSRVYFVPKSSFTGTANVSFYGYDVEGERFSGTVKIRVGSGGGSGHSDGVVSYEVYTDEAVTFSASDFNSLCRDELGETLSYVRFTLPASREGTLYYDYTGSGRYDSKVSASTRYYRNEDPYLGQVTFVPKSGYTGTVEIDFTGYASDGEKFTGTVEIEVGGGGRSSDGTVSYRSSGGEETVFSASDFNDVCREVLGSSLSYVRFTPPSSSRGALYYNYRSSSNTGSAVTSGAKYYRNSSPGISQVSFVPKSGYSGTVEIEFTGYTSDGDRFDGVVEIRVDKNGAGASTTLRYSMLSGNVITFEPSLFNNVCKEELDSNLSYVRFTPPSSSEGALYYNYDRDKQTYDSKVTSSTSYYRSGGSKLLSKVSFVPADGFSGTVNLEYTGWSTGGKKFTGTVTVTVTTPVAEAVRYSTGAGAVAFRSGDFNSACTDLLGKNLSWVRLTPTASSIGRLYYDYTGPGQYGAEVRATVSYYRGGTPELDRVSFVPRAGFQGTASISYTGEDTAGNSYSGTVLIQVSPTGGASKFTDMAGYDWAAGAVSFLYENGVASGVSATQFGPGQSITRGDFVLMLCKAFELDTGSTTSFSDVPADSYYARAVATAKDLAITTGSDGNRFYPESGVTRQDAMVLLQKTMQAAGWSIPDGAAASLSGYSDRGGVDAYAQGAVAAMVELGVITGDSSGRLDPDRILTRAEMAVILHQALTL